MMSINKILLFAVIAIAFISGEIQTSVADETEVLPWYAGTWYTVGIIFNKGYNPNIACKWIFVKKLLYNSASRFYLEDRRYIGPNREKKYRFDGNGDVANTTVEVSLFAAEQKDTYYDATCVRDCDDVILIDRTSKPFSELISRSPTSSPGAKLKFEDIAEKGNFYVHYVDHNNCTYPRW